MFNTDPETEDFDYKTVDFKFMSIKHWVILRNNVPAIAILIYNKFTVIK